DAGVRLRPAGRGRDRRGRESAQAVQDAGGRVAVRRGHLRRRRGQGGGVHHGLQTGPAAAHPPAGRQWLHGGPGFGASEGQLAGDSEQAGIIRSGAKLVNVISNSVVPKITVILGGSYGAGNYALCGKAFDPRFLFAWPTARYAVMGGEQAASTLLEITLTAMKRAGHECDAKEMAELRRKVEASYHEQTDFRYAAARLWVDKIIEPAQTRSALLTALAVALRHDDGQTFKTGVLQV